jgi:hypothetical protein
MIRKALLSVLALGGAFASGVFCAHQPVVVHAESLTPPVVNIGTRHGNLRAAQENIVQAFQKISDAQLDNNDRLGGHAENAKKYLVNADSELRAAANVANSH